MRKVSLSKVKEWLRLKCCLKCFKILSGEQEDVLLDVFNVVVCLLAVANNLSSSLVAASTFSFSASFLKCSFLSCLDLLLPFYELNV